jgi:hypothetical protein
MSRSWAVTLTAAALLFPGAKARAAELAGAELSVLREDAAADCPDADELGRRIRALWMAPAASAPMRVEVQFTRSVTGYDADLRASGAHSGTRHLSTSAATCESLSEAVTVALALLLDMEPLPAASESPPAPPPPVPSMIAHPESRRPPFELALASSLGLGLGVLGSQPSGLGSGSVLARRGHFAAEALAFFVAPRSFDYDPGFVKVSLWGGALNACYRTRATGERGLGWRPCLGFRGGRLSGAGTRYDVNSSASQAWFALSLSGHLELPLSARFRLVSGLLLWLPLARHEFRVYGRGAAFETPALAATLQLGLELTIW